MHHRLSEFFQTAMNDWIELRSSLLMENLVLLSPQITVDPHRAVYMIWSFGDHYIEYEISDHGTSFFYRDRKADTNFFHENLDFSKPPEDVLSALRPLTTVFRITEPQS